MFKYFLKTSIRSISRNRIFSLINIFGLALGISASYFIYKYVSYEWNFDQFHTRKDQIYRVTVDRYQDGIMSQQWAAASAAVGPAMKSNFPEVLDFVKMHRKRSTLTYEDISFREEKAFFVTEAFFKIFSFELISGVDSLVLSEPFSIAISESTASRYFKNQDAINKVIKLNGKYDLKVTGVFKDVPENSHMKFDVLYSFETLVAINQTTPDEGNGDVQSSWGAYGFYNYVLVDEGVNPSVLESKIADLVNREYGDVLKREGKQLVFNLQPIKEIHLNSHLMREFEVNGDEGTVLSLVYIAIFIMIIAWVNYVNLATTKTIDRAREIGVKKALGSGKLMLLKQFLFEALVLNVLAGAMAALLIILSVSHFNQITEQHLNTNVFTNLDYWVFIATAAILGTFFAGIYPAIVMTRLKPAATLKGKYSRSERGKVIRKSLVVFQFGTSIILMISVFIAAEQVDFMRNKELGIDIDRTLIVKAPSVVVDSTYYQQHNAFKSSLVRHTSISSVTVSSQVPGYGSNGSAGSVRLIGQSESQGKAYLLIAIDYDFVNSYGLKILAGRNFSKDFGFEWNSALLNETAVLHAGFSSNEEAIGHVFELFQGGPKYKIVGVINDYHQESLKTNFEPTIFTFHPLREYYSIKINKENINESIAVTKTEYDTFFEGNPFDYFFLDEHYDKQYKDDLRFAKIIGVAAFLAIIVACLGLFGLSTFTVAQRNKEVGIRKVLGASVNSILILLTKSFLSPLVVAFLLAIPIAWYTMNNWLNNYAYKLDLSWWLFVIPGGISIVIALITLSFQTVKTAVTNPIEYLQEE